MRTGELGFWWRSLAEQAPGDAPAPRRDPLPGPSEADVAIVGAGYTGLWTAYYLKRAQPSLRVVVLEAERAGYGASGRNGGWATGFFSGPPRIYERDGGREGFLALQRAMFDAVDEIGRVLAHERIDADFLNGGHLTVALDRAQALRLHAH
ncbi:MAG TPA: FAD-binding oxidoreductase, partial [Solirubrobacteraceae bacterium]